MAKRRGHVNTLLFFRALRRVLRPAAVGILSSPPLPWRTCSPQTTTYSTPQLGHRAGCTGFFLLVNFFLKGHLALTLTNMNATGRRPRVSPSTVSQHHESSLLRSPVMNGTNFCPTATDKLGLGEPSRPWGLHLSAHGPEELTPMSPWLCGGSVSMVSLPAEPQGWDLFSESQK